ncbi:DNA double-strand break repair nuclease NurA [Fischerella thermalis]|uniref:DNA double-strand break repair nuclease NurA n=1 Tax=Fischerella thermalis TaxID=372787 RepID=UPI0002F7093F|nr:DNA double-strand break repair nuclease NurA [Fischerella thermalis]PLZ07133.1 nuclease [Fischerella thermalis WC114]PLZ10360.1 nuclease [Fischerella thermalis WC119]PLZ10605.1 nuclease [Fischerella thermalis WC1110]PLZ17335.1 nuclease [Fischerella thermalis WC157]PLZ17784.1 nuclease [Fischerella thermalis WC341]
MLDLTKLTRQMQGLSQHLTQEAAASRQRLELAQQHFLNACDRQEEFIQKQEKWRDRILFASATPVEPLNTCIEIPVPPKVHTVIATDGSQIAPNHHEIAYCYLLNIGRVVLHYGQNKHPLLDSLPEIFYRPEDLYISRQWGIKTEEWMSYCRTASEATVLAELACSVVSKNTETSPPHTSRRDESRLYITSHTPHTPPTPKIPTLAMVDGSLIYWFLEQLPFDARDRILPPILQAWRQMRDAQIPLMGYLSASRNIEAMNFLRLLACPHPVPDCMSFCPNQLEKVPCKVFEPLRDTTLWTTQLQPGQRGPLWRSNARILDLYEDLQIYFCYVHVGAEIARIEIPAWVAENTSLFEESLGLMLAQVQKGYGYPVAIAEAHNQAVVRGGDKARFFALLERQMIKAGLRNVGTSYKEARKRGSIA